MSFVSPWPFVPLFHVFSSRTETPVSRGREQGNLNKQSPTEFNSLVIPRVGELMARRGKAMA